jgi:opacity protein-like surface antigen
MKFRLLLLLTALALVLSLPGSSMAEGFSDLYLGMAFTQNETITVAQGTGNVTGEIDFDDVIVLGYRLGYWFERLPWMGMGLDISYFGPGIDSTTDLTIIPITPLLMLRSQLLKSARYPTGEWQPYVAVGPGIFYSRIDAGDYDDTQWVIGLDARAGLKKMFSSNFGAFVEYRYTTFSPEFDDPIVDRFDIVTHHAVIGISVNLF